LAQQVSLATIVEPTQGRGSQGNAGEGDRPISLLASFRPCVLGFAALAITVALWGYGYKLSLYHQRDHTSAIPVAKLWIEHRDATALAAFSLPGNTHSIPVSLSLWAAAPGTLRADDKSDVLQSIEARGTATQGALIPSRSPPRS
jgi:hypothetical protein